MNRVCQGPYAIFGLGVAVLLAAVGARAVEPVAKTAGNGVLLRLAVWEPRPFADVVMGHPELAACFLISQGRWASSGRPDTLPDEGALATALATQLRGLGDPSPATQLEIFLATAENTTIAAVAHGDTALVLVPRDTGATPLEIARALAPALLLAANQPAPPDSRCDEPLLALGEAIATAGTLAFAELPPALRPVRDWLEPKDVLPALASAVERSLDADTSWQERRALLTEMGRLGGASPKVANAAALVVEAFGDAALARRRPFDLLLAWESRANKEFPAMPHELRKALGRPLEAGLPKEKDDAGRGAIARDAVLRRLTSDASRLTDVPNTLPFPLRLLAAARERARGTSGLCEWLTSAPLPTVRTGCRGEGEEGGIVFARPRTGFGFEVVWRSSSGDEGVVLSWPRWLLFPQVDSAHGELWFIDAQGLWRLPLDAHAAPQLAARGTFRHLAIAPGGGAVATARWPSGHTVVVTTTGARELAVDGRGGLAWLEPDLVLVSDGEKLSLASLEGDVRAAIFPLSCCGSLVAGKTGITAAVMSPCEPALVRVALAARSTTQLVKLPGGPLGLAAWPDGSIVFGATEGIWRWRGEGQPERVGAGVTPGPG